MTDQYYADVERIVKELGKPNLYRMIDEGEEVVVESQHGRVALRRVDGDIIARYLDTKDIDQPEVRLTES